MANTAESNKTYHKIDPKNEAWTQYVQQVPKKIQGTDLEGKSLAYRPTILAYTDTRIFEKLQIQPDTKLLSPAI